MFETAMNYKKRLCSGKQAHLCLHKAIADARADGSQLQTCECRPGRLRDQGRGHQGEVAGEPVGLRKGHVNAGPGGCVIKGVGAGPGGCVIKGVGIKVRLRASRWACARGM